MIWKSAFFNGPLNVTVTYLDGSPLVLYTGSIGLSQSVDFPDADTDFTDTLAVDADGVVSLSSTGDGWTGGNYLVDFSLPGGDWVYQLVACSAPGAVGGTPNLYGDVDGMQDLFSGSSYVFSTTPTSSFGFSANPGGN